MDKVALDQAIATLRENAEGWARRPLQRKIAHVEQLIAGTQAVAARQVAAAGYAKGAERDQHRGEEWIHGPLLVTRNLRMLRRALREIATHGRPQLPKGSVTTRSDGQVVARIFPLELFDKLLYGGFTADVWMQPDVTVSNLSQSMASFYRDPNPQGRVALVLGAGNGPSIGPLDAVYKLFVEGQVVLLKMNPVNEYLAPFIEEAFAPLVQAGYLRVVCGGADVGAYLCQHEGIDEVHITGSDRTHDAIVFGVGKDGEKRKRENRPLLDKRITSELGNVSPVIIVPGQWTAAELRFQAENVATQMSDNAGFNCNATKLLVTHRDWPQRRAFLDELRAVLLTVPPRKAYYPGAEDRWDSFVGSHTQAETFGQRSGGRLPWALIPGLDPTVADEQCFNAESFCGVTGETSLPGSDASDFLRRAVDFANGTLWGTLNASILIDPRTHKAHAEALEDAIAGLRYGTVAVNHWAALCYGLGSPPWGAFPGHTLDDIKSGIGVVHNTFMFEKSEKTVIRGPFRIFPKPPWFVTNRATDRIAPLLVRFEADPSLAKLPGVLLAALRG